MIYVLIMWHLDAMITAEFDNQDACVNAATSFASTMKPAKDGKYDWLRAVCAPKGGVGPTIIID